jgi:predicted DNA-binding protein
MEAQVVATTIRMPEELRKRLKEWAEQEHRSVNDLTVELLEQATLQRSTEQALAAATRVRAKIRSRHGMGSDSVADLRAIREERSLRG